MMILIFFGAPFIRMMILKRLYIFSMCCKNGFWLLFLLLILSFFFGRFFSSSEGHSNTKVSACLLVSQYPTFSKTTPIIKKCASHGRIPIARISAKVNFASRTFFSFYFYKKYFFFTVRGRKAGNAAHKPSTHRLIHIVPRLGNVNNISRGGPPHKNQLSRVSGNHRVTPTPKHDRGRISFSLFIHNCLLLCAFLSVSSYEWEESRAGGGRKNLVRKISKTNLTESLHEERQRKSLIIKLILHYGIFGSFWFGDVCLCNAINTQSRECFFLHFQPFSYTIFFVHYSSLFIQMKMFYFFFDMWLSLMTSHKRSIFHNSKTCNRLSR